MSWSLWAILGIVMIIFEIISPTFFALFVGIGFFVSALMSYLFPEALVLQLLCASVGIVVAVVVFKKGKIGDDASVSVGQSNEYAGIKGRVITPLGKTSDGEVILDEPMLGETVWRAKSVSNEEVNEGVRIEVVAIHGQSLIVTPI